MAAGSGLPLLDIRELQRIEQEAVGPPKPIAFTDQIVGVVEYRHGTVIDVLRAPAHKFCGPTEFCF